MGISETILTITEIWLALLLFHSFTHLHSKMFFSYNIRLICLYSSNLKRQTLATNPPPLTARNKDDLTTSSK